ncbi:MAG: PadR family transcriptional regulator, partial [Pseudonocardiaceae bacterium]
MRERARALDDDVAARRAALEQSNGPGRLFLIEAEYALAMHRAEAAWVRSLLAQIADGTFPDVAGWREFHETG